MPYRTTHLKKFVAAAAIFIAVIVWSQRRNPETPTSARPSESSPPWLMQGHSREALVPLRQRAGNGKNSFSMTIRLVKNQIPFIETVYPPKSPKRWFFIQVDKLFTPDGQEMQHDGLMLMHVRSLVFYKQILWRPLSGGAWQVFHTNSNDTKQQPKPVTSESWMAAKMQQDALVADKLRKEERNTRYSTGEWKFVVQGQAAWFDLDGTFLCETGITRERILRVTPQTLLRRFHEEQRTYSATEWRTRKTPASNDERQNPLSYLQWQSSRRPGWKRVAQGANSQQAHPQKPIVISEDEHIQLRAMRRHPERPWPADNRQMVRWRQDGGRDDERDDITAGDTYRISMPFPMEAPRIITVSASYGTRLTAAFRVVPGTLSTPASLSLQLASSSWMRNEILAGGGESDDYQAHLTAETSDCYNTTRIRISSTYADGRTAGKVNKLGAEDNEIYHKVDSCTDRDISFSVRSGWRTGPVSVVAEALDLSGKVVARSNPVNIIFVEPKIDGNRSHFGPWEERKGVLQRTVHVGVTTPGGRQVKGVPLELSIDSPTSYPVNRRASWLSPARGVTGESGEFVTTQFWKLIPGASLHLDNYAVKANLRRPSQGSTAR